MPKTLTFDLEYKKLNREQKAAVDAIEGPVMVIAGPGTGKTQILTLRTANILRKTDTAPENILALTFTEAASAEMRRRLAELIGSRAYSVAINTFHGFCNNIIKNYPDEFPRIVGSTNITEVDQIKLIEDIVSSARLKKLKPFGDPLYYVKDILNAINNLKREGVDPKTFAVIVKSERKRFDALPHKNHDKGHFAGRMKSEYQKLLDQMERNEELAAIYKNYEDVLRTNRLYDYSDMIMEVLRELRENKDLLYALQEEHQYLLVDEHQDTNNAQNKVLEFLASFHPNPNLFVVGDEKQAIFRFQGASLENFTYFRKLYPGAKLIALTENYRSTQTILDSAHHMLPGEKPLKANVKHPERNISLLAFSKPEVECFFVAKDIERKLASGTEPREIAVLYHDNKDAFPFVRMFEKLDIPFVIESDQDILADPDIRKLILLFRAVAEFGNPQRALEAFHADFLGVSPLDLYKIIDATAHPPKFFGEKFRRINPYDIIRSEERLSRLEVEHPEKLREVYGKLAGWARGAKSLPLTDMFEIIVRESGFLAYLLQLPDTVEKITKLEGLFDEAKSLIEKHKNYGLKDFLGYLDTLAAHNLLVKRSIIQSSEKAVRLMTAHRAKGQEFEHVYIVHAHDGHWGNRRRSSPLTLPGAVYSLSGGALSQDAANDDERRLFYVALTRAKKHVTITYSRMSASGREQVPSQFVKELKPELVQEENTEPYEQAFAKDKTLPFSPRIVRTVSIRDKEFITKLFHERGLAVTGLNNFLECPWKYFYTNLLRIPKAQEPYLMFGTAVHRTLKDFFDALHERKVDKKFLLASFDRHLQREPLAERDYEPYKERGHEALSGWHDAYRGAWRTRVLTEVNIPAVFLNSDVRLTGKLDKIEFLGDGNDVNVVDYKTGKPKSLGDIEGHTKSVRSGDIKRQLVFYNLLLNGYEGGKKFHMVSGDVDFVEPDQAGRYHKYPLTVRKDEIKELAELITDVASQIVTLSFWDKRCDDPKCEFCALREMMA